MHGVFITGASSGIGEGLARRYAARGTTIGLVARREERLRSLASDLEARGARPLIYAADVSDTDELERIAGDFAERAERVDLVIANAGVGIPSGLLEGEVRPVRRLMEINVIGVTNTIIPFVPRMVEQNAGTLVAVSSMAGHRGLPGRAAYSASKAAVITFMDGLRMDLHDTRVHAMTICPGFVRTPMTDVLDHRMPFLVECDDAVELMAEAIERRERTFTFPWQMNLLKHVAKSAPEWLLRRASPGARRHGTLGD